MKFMHISDLHIGKKVHDFSMIEDQKYILNQIIEKITNNNVEVLIIAGDVYDKSIPSIEAISLFDDFINKLVKLDIYVLIISGNHDSLERLSYLNSLLKKSKIYINSNYNNKIEKIKIEDVNFYLFPFLKPSSVKKYDENIIDYNSMMQYLINSCEINKEEKNVAIVHQFLTGSILSDSEELSIGGIDNIDYSLFLDFNYTALGHLHRPQKLMQDTIRYSGSILKYSFSESNDKKSCVIVNSDDFSFVLDPLIPHKDMVEIKGYYDEVVSLDFYKDLNLENYYHITLLDEENIYDGINKLRVIYKNIMKLDYSNQRTKQDNLIEAKTNKTPIEFLNELYIKQNNVELNETQITLATDLINEIWGEK